MFSPINQLILGADCREQRMQFGAVVRQPRPSVLLQSLQIPDSSIIVRNEKSKWGTTDPCHSLQCAEHPLCTGCWEYGNESSFGELAASREDKASP